MSNGLREWSVVHWMSDSTRCIYCDYKQWFQHPRYAYLLSDKRELNETTDLGQELTGPKHIGLTRHPFMRLNQQNRVKGFHTGAKPTNLHGQHWQHELIIGPFYHQGKRFKDEWRGSARGMESRYKMACELVKKYNSDEEFLGKNTPLVAGVTRSSVVESTENKDVLEMSAKEKVPLGIFCRNPEFTQHVFDRPNPSSTGVQQRKKRSHSHSSSAVESSSSVSCSKRSESILSFFSSSVSGVERISPSSSDV